MKFAKRRLRNKLRKLVVRRRECARRLKEIEAALVELGETEEKLDAKIGAACAGEEHA